MDNCKGNIEAISMLLDGELGDEQASELRAHIDQCETCKRVFDAFSAISGSLGDDLAEPPEMLAKGVMFKIKLMQEGGGRRRFAFGRFTAIAACLAIIIFGASRLGLLNGSFGAKGAMEPQVAAAGTEETMLEAAPEAENGGRNSILGADFFNSLKLNLSKTDENVAADEAPAENSRVTQFGFGILNMDGTTANMQVEKNDFLLFIEWLLAYADENDPENDDEDFAFFRTEDEKDIPVTLRIYEGLYEKPAEDDDKSDAEKQPEPLLGFADLENLRAFALLFMDAGILEDEQETEKILASDPSYTLAVFDKDDEQLDEKLLSPLHLWAVGDKLYFKTSPEGELMLSACTAEELTKFLDSFKEEPVMVRHYYVN